MSENLTDGMLKYEFGIDSIKTLSSVSRVNRQTLINWHKSKPYLFAVVVDGVKLALKKKERLIETRSNSK